MVVFLEFPEKYKRTLAEFSFTLQEPYGRVEVYRRMGEAIDEEVFYKLETFASVYEVARVSRGNKRNTLELKNLPLAQLALTLLAVAGIGSAVHPVPKQIYEYFAKNAQDTAGTQKELDAILDPRYYQMWSLKPAAICLMQDENGCGVYCVDKDHTAHAITQNRQNQDIALQVMFNFAWKAPMAV